MTVWTLLLLFATQLTGAQEITDPAVPSREASSRVRYIHLQSDTDTGARWRPEGDSGETWLAGSAANASEPPNLGEDSYYTYDDQKIPLEIVPGGFVLRDRGQPDNQDAGSLIESDIARIAGKGLHRQALGYGYATFSVVPLDTLWARRNASSPPPLDQFHAYRWARKVIRSLASYSTTQEDGRYVFSPLYTGYRLQRSRMCFLLYGARIAVSFDASVSLARSEAILKGWTGGHTDRILDFTQSRAHLVEVPVTSGMTALIRTNRIATHPEVRWAEPSGVTLGCGGPSGGGGGSGGGTPPTSVPSFTAAGKAVLALVLAALALALLRRPHI